MQRLRTAAEPLTVFALSRVTVWLLAVVSYALIDPVARLENVDFGWVTGIWAQWDGAWYLAIAEHGYDANPDRHPAFHPLYPLLTGALGRILGGHYVVAGIAVSLVAGAVAFVLLHRLAATRLDADGARRTLVYLAIFPGAVFLTAVYTESLFLALALAAFVAADRNRFAVAGVAAGFAMLTRMVGVALVPALLLLAWRSPERRRALLGVALAPLVFAIWPLLLELSIGEPFAFLTAAGEWGRELRPLGPIEGVARGVGHGAGGVAYLVTGNDGALWWPHSGDSLETALTAVVDGATVLVFGALAILAWRRFGAALGLYAVLVLAIPLTSFIPDNPLTGTLRYVLVCFPAFLVLGAAGRRAWLDRVVVVTSVVGLVIVTGRWAAGTWVA